MTSEERKRAAMAFYDLTFNECRPREAVEGNVGGEYIQHNPGVGDGKDAFIEYFERMARDCPGKARRVQARDRGGRPGRAALLPDLARGRRLRGIDIFRFDEGGRIVEHWDVLQVIPAEAKNDNGMF